MAVERSTTSQKSCGDAQDKRGYKIHDSLKYTFTSGTSIGQLQRFCNQFNDVWVRKRFFAGVGRFVNYGNSSRLFVSLDRLFLNEFVVICLGLGCIGKVLCLGLASCPDSSPSGRN